MTDHDLIAMSAAILGTLAAILALAAILIILA